MTPWAVINPARLAGSGLLRTQTDARLVDLVRAGNDRAFEAIVLRYHKPLLRHCRRLLPAGRAEDAVQQSFLRALEAMRADERELQLGAWLHRIAHNTAIDSLRRMDSDWEELDDRMDGVEPTHAAVERRARFSSVLSTMGSLPERQRRALVLREMEGRSYEEIAATLGVTGAGVRQLLNRARNAMRAAATALVPPALIGRVAGSPAGVRVAELIAPPGTGTLLVKAGATAAAGAVALLAVGGPPSGDGDRVPPAKAGTKPPAVQLRPDSAERSRQAAVRAAMDSDTREPRGAGRRDERLAGERRGAVRNAAGPGATTGGSRGDDGADARSVPGRLTGGDVGGGDDDAPVVRTTVGSGDDNGAAPAPRAPTGSDDAAPVGAGAGATVSAPPTAGSGAEPDDDGAPVTSSVPSTSAAPAATSTDDSGEEPDD